MTERPTEQPTELLSVRPTDEVTKQATEQHTNRQWHTNCVTQQPSQRPTEWPTVRPRCLLLSEEYPFNRLCSHHSPHWEDRNCGRLKNNDERKIGWMRTWLNETGNLGWLRDCLQRKNQGLILLRLFWGQKNTFLGVFEVNIVVW